jgi:P pilus assembly chaperone PapD
MVPYFRNRMLLFVFMAAWSLLAAAGPGAIRLSPERTRIVASEQNRAAAVSLQRDLATAVSGEIPIIDDAQLTDEQMAQYDLILLGDLNTNRVTARL